MRSKYLSIFSHSFIFTLWSNGTAKPTGWQVLFFLIINTIIIIIIIIIRCCYYYLSSSLLLLMLWRRLVTSLEMHLMHLTADGNVKDILRVGMWNINRWVGLPGDQLNDWRCWLVSVSDTAVKLQKGLPLIRFVAGRIRRMVIISANGDRDLRNGSLN